MAALWIQGEPAVGPVIAAAALAWGAPTNLGVRPWSLTWLTSAALTTAIDTPVLSVPFWIALLTPPLAVPIASAARAPTGPWTIPPPLKSMSP